MNNVSKGYDDWCKSVLVWINKSVHDVTSANAQFDKQQNTKSTQVIATSN